MKEFNEDFKTKLYQTIEDIENNSLVEIVAIFRQQSEKYKDVGFMVSSILTLAVFSTLMFIHISIDAYLIYLITVLTFIISFLVTMTLPSVLRLFIPKKRIEKSVEIMGRAIFQKGGIRFTEQRIGVLIFVSYFEKKVFLLADRGIILSVPQEDMEEMNEQFNSIFKTGNIADNFLKSLYSTKDIFSEFIPPVENDINELPDNLIVEL